MHAEQRNTHVAVHTISQEREAGVVSRREVNSENAELVGDVIQVWVRRILLDLGDEWRQLDQRRWVLDSCKRLLDRRVHDARARDRALRIEDTTALDVGDGKGSGRDGGNGSEETNNDLAEHFYDADRAKSIGMEKMKGMNRPESGLRN